MIIDTINVDDFIIETIKIDIIIDMTKTFEMTKILKNYI